MEVVATGVAGAREVEEFVEGGKNELSVSVAPISTDKINSTKKVNSTRTLESAESDTAKLTVESATDA